LAQDKSSCRDGKPSHFFYGYVVVATSFAIQVIGWGIHNSYGVFFNPIIEEFGWGRASVAGAASLSILVHGLLSIFVGALNDRTGPRIIMTCCGLLMGSGYLLMAGTDTLWEVYLYYGVIIGMGVSGTDVVLLSTVARWFIRLRGAMSGILKVGTGLGMVIAPIFITVLLRFFKWRTCFAILGVIIAGSYVLLAQFLVRDPALKGQSADNAGPADSNCLRGPEGGLTYREAVATRQFWSLCLICALTVSCTYTMLMHLVPHLIDTGMTPTQAATVLSTVGAVSIVGRLVMGTAADRIGVKWALAVTFAMMFAGLTVLNKAGTAIIYYVFAVVHGFAHGAFFALMSPAVAAFFGTRSHGILLGTVIFSGTIGGAAGPVLGGHLFDMTGTYRILFMSLAGASLGSLLLTLSLRPKVAAP
jgi:MFS family permease